LTNTVNFEYWKFISYEKFVIQNTMFLDKIYSLPYCSLLEWSRFFISKLDEQFKETFLESNSEEELVYIHLPFLLVLYFCGCNKRITKNPYSRESYITLCFKNGLYCKILGEKPQIKRFIWVEELHLFS
jgi:coproporphyrinogen III oxidase-like Fe-S oxidoreductase